MSGHGTGFDNAGNPNPSPDIEERPDPRHLNTRNKCGHLYRYWHKDGCVCDCDCSHWTCLLCETDTLRNTCERVRGLMDSTTGNLITTGQLRAALADDGKGE